MNETEEAVRHLFAVATEDIPPGIDLLRSVRGRRRTRVVRTRVALSAVTAAVLAAAAAITLSAVQAPSALAQGTKAAAQTAGQSYQVRSAGRYMYLSLSEAFRAAYREASGVSIPAGKSWLRFPAPLRPGGEATLVELAHIGFATPDLGQVSPQDLLALLGSATQVSQTGPASGD